MKTVLQTRMTE